MTFATHAHAVGLKVHLDGARIFNAATRWAKASHNDAAKWIR